MRNPLTSLLDSSIAQVFPSWGLKRLQARVQYNMTSSVIRKSGTDTGTMSGWMPSFLTRWLEGRNRFKSTVRAQDLVNNNPHAASIVDSMATNIAGTGLQLQPRPRGDLLGWSESEINFWQKQCEYIWEIWCKEADAQGRIHMDGLQFLTTHNILTNGEAMNLPVMLQDPDRTFSLALQNFSPHRVSTPIEYSTEPQVRDGIRLDGIGRPETYFVYNPSNPQSLISDLTTQGHPLSEYAQIKARLGHRPGIFHTFLQKESEQVRGTSVLSPSMKLFKDLGDYLDFELVGAIIASSFAVWIESEDGAAVGNAQTTEEETDEEGNIVKYQAVDPGAIYYGNAGERPHILKSERPGNTFDPFVERVLRAAGAAAGMPYELTTKDFSKTNYSSAKAALLEAIRVFRLYQRWLVFQFLQPLYEMVLEEAFLRGMLRIPPVRWGDQTIQDPNFYTLRHVLTRSRWIPPKRGFIDPYKEMMALIEGKKANILTLQDIVAENGGSTDDWRDHLAQKGKENRVEQDIKEDPQNEEVKRDLQKTMKPGDDEE